MSKKICQYLDEVFPPPQYLTMPALSVDLSDSFARFIVFEKKKGLSTIKYFGSEPIPQGAFKTMIRLRKTKNLSVFLLNYSIYYSVLFS